MRKATLSACARLVLPHPDKPTSAQGFCLRCLTFEGGHGSSKPKGEERLLEILGMRGEGERSMQKV